MSVVGIHLIHLGSELLIGLRRGPGLSFLYVIYSLAPQQSDFCIQLAQIAEKRWGKMALSFKAPLFQMVGYIFMTLAVITSPGNDGGVQMVSLCSYNVYKVLWDFPNSGR